MPRTEGANPGPLGGNEALALIEGSRARIGVNDVQPDTGLAQVARMVANGRQQPRADAPAARRGGDRNAVHEQRARDLAPVERRQADGPDRCAQAVLAPERGQADIEQACPVLLKPGDAESARVVNGDESPVHAHRRGKEPRRPLDRSEEGRQLRLQRLAIQSGRLPAQTFGHTASDGDGIGHPRGGGDGGRRIKGAIDMGQPVSSRRRTMSACGRREDRSKNRFRKTFPPRAERPPECLDPLPAPFVSARPA